MPEAPEKVMSDEWAPDLHEIVMDTESGKPGTFAGTFLSGIWLRPVGGGREWRTEHIRPATQDEKHDAEAARRRSTDQ
ncbi:hypothetical protein ACIBAH_34785 [Streptomyces sp. NPDC051445]|uniref:hypothetical protein n=1 Tax=Streptomyces sp. NPDC051445 TaxID=3365653 RepID=UPI0037A8FF46